MSRQVRLSIEAGRDLAQIREWYRQPGAGPPARARLNRIIAAIDGLVRSPCSYQRGFLPETRQFICEQHKIVFRIEPDTNDNLTSGDVFVVHITGPGQSDD